MEKVLTFRPVTVAEVFSAPDADMLISEYMAESGNPFLPQKPNVDYYRKAEESGAFKVIGAFSGERLVGFGSFVLTVIPHYSTVTASVESVFLSKDFRRGAAGFRLINAVSQSAKDAGASGIYWGCRSGSRLETLFARVPRFTRMNTVFYEALA